MYSPNTKIVRTCGISLTAAWLYLGSALAQTQPVCPRPPSGSAVAYPLDLFSQNGSLQVDLTLRNGPGDDGLMRYCYLYQDSVEAPALHVKPGDTLLLNLINRITPDSTASAHHEHGSAASASGPCSGGTMTAASTNVHFHGMNVPPTCHQDDVLNTIIQPTDPPFPYRLTIPTNEPPGLYWYHPHPHGFSEAQVLGGASGPLIVDGIEQAKPQVAGLTERVFVIRDQLPTAGGGSLKIKGGAEVEPAKTLTINYVPATYPDTRAPSIVVPPGQREFWRVLNASADTFVALQVRFANKPQTLELIATDGVPVGRTEAVSPQRLTINLPPAGRAEFIVQTPDLNVPAELITKGMDTGPDGDLDPPLKIADILASADAPAGRKIPTSGQGWTGAERFASLSTLTPVTQRKLYFSEQPHDPNDPNSPTDFFITVDGQTPKVFDMNDPPAIVVNQGAIEDWTIENRSGEDHAFHIHQLHFLVLEKNGRSVVESDIRDTVDVPYWDGKSSTYPSVKVRMDFRDPEIVGTFVYHCHLLEHEDGGMMAKIEVVPR